VERSAGGRRKAVGLGRALRGMGICAPTNSDEPARRLARSPPDCGEPKKRDADRLATPGKLAVGQFMPKNTPIRIVPAGQAALIKALSSTNRHK